MKRDNKYVALDVHASNDGSLGPGRKRTDPGAEHLIPTEGRRPGVLSGNAGIDPCDFRGGDPSPVALRPARAWVDRVLVCDRRGEKRRGPKARPGDADRLSHRLRVGDLRPVYHGRPAGNAAGADAHVQSRWCRIRRA